MDAFHPQNEPIEIEELRALTPAMRRRLRRAVRLTLAELERSIKHRRPMTWPNLRRLLLRRLHDAMRHASPHDAATVDAVLAWLGRQYEAVLMDSRSTPQR
jgi:hypothetical protein